MRLVCPSCDAKYEVPDDAIPDTGRDVQCASCGHAWFQTRSRAVSAVAPAAEPAPTEPAAGAEMTAAPDPEPVAEAATEAQVAPEISPPEAAGDGASDNAPVKTAKKRKAAEAALAAAIESPEPEPEVTPPAPEAEAEAAPEAELPATEDTAETVADTAPPAPAVDEKVLTILREEAEREAKARKGEVQPEPATPAVSAPRKKGAAAKPMPEPEPESEPDSELERPAARRDLLPDVEEINSTLRPTEVPDPEFATGQVTAGPREVGGGFRAGFMLVISLTLLATALYISSGRLAALVPSLSGPLEAYVGFVDGLRFGLDGLMQSATRLISGDGA